MAKNHQVNHEYYANFETCRNRWFDSFVGLQNEDFHLNVMRSVNYDYDIIDFDDDEL